MQLRLPFLEIMSRKELALVMKGGKDICSSNLESLDENAVCEVQQRFSHWSNGLGAYSLYFVCDEDLFRDLQVQGALDTFIQEAGELFNDF